MSCTPTGGRRPTASSTPTGLARSLPGVAEIGGPVIVAAMGDPDRFPDAAAFKRFTGLTPRASETGNTDRKGGAMSKAGPRRLRDQLVQSANTARRFDPQLAEVYFTQMERGAHHQKALCVVAARLAERAWVGAVTRPGLRAARRRRHTGHPGRGPLPHPGALHRLRGGPPAPAIAQEREKAPHQVL